MGLGIPERSDPPLERRGGLDIEFDLLAIDLINPASLMKPIKSFGHRSWGELPSLVFLYILSHINMLRG